MTGTTFEIKDGDIFDLPLVTNEMKVFNELAKIAYAKFLTYDAKSVSASMTSVIQAGGKFWVLWNGDDFAGVCMGMISHSFWDSSQTVAECLFVGVLPEHQKTRWGTKLEKKFEEWAHEQKADFVCYGGYDKNFIRAKKRKGFEQINVQLMKRLSDG